MTRRVSEAGVALLEVLVAIGILSSAGLAFTVLLRQGVIAQRETAAEERLLDEADRVLAASTLLGAGDLDQRLGLRRVGEFAV